MNYGGGDAIFFFWLFINLFMLFAYCIIIILFFIELILKNTIKYKFEVQYNNDFLNTIFELGFVFLFTPIYWWIFGWSTEPIHKIVFISIPIIIFLFWRFSIKKILLG